MSTVAPAPAAVSTGDGPAAIEVTNLSHRYPAARGGRRGGGPSAAQPAPPALDAVSFRVRAGEVFGILGPNGGGKSTLFRILATTLQPSAGRVAVFGHDPATQADAVRALLGVVFQNPSLDIQLTVRENLLHQGRLYGLHGAPLRQRIEALLAGFGLADRQDEYARRFSGGMRRRIEIAKALLPRPRLLLLDEPSTGLDPGARADLWRQLEGLSREHGQTIALTTHFMDEADRCDRLAILSAGRLIAQGTPAQLKAAIRGDVVAVEPVGDAADLCRQITADFGPWPAQALPRVIDGKVRLEHADGPAWAATLAAALAGKIRSITVGQPTLDDVFMTHTGRGLWDRQDTAP
jgi:ABC-2 type transport system ATP-binding protein